MRRIVAFALLVAVSGSWVIPATAQQMSVAQYQRKSAKDAEKQQKLQKKAAKQQAKTQKKANKAQNKQLKAARKADAKANRQLHH
jgi:lipopolysaccharide export LptBFGC system permease protein LptF